MLEVAYDILCTGSMYQKPVKIFDMEGCPFSIDFKLAVVHPCTMKKKLEPQTRMHLHFLVLAHICHFHSRISLHLVETGDSRLERNIRIEDKELLLLLVA